MASKASKNRYYCPRWPFLNIQDIVKFNNGIFDVQNEKERQLIESRPEYGSEIWRHGSERHLEKLAIHRYADLLIEDGEEAIAEGSSEDDSLEVEAIPEGAPSQGARGTRKATVRKKK